MARKLVPKNKLYVGDNLDVMHGMNSCTVDLIYLDPPPVRADLETLTWTKKRFHARRFDKQSGRCNGCKKPFEAYHLEIDHIYPKSLGGAWLLENLQLLCGDCNRIKGDRPMEYLRARLAERRERQKAVF